MMKKIFNLAASSALIVASSAALSSDDVVGPLTEFIPNTAAKASAVNGNFTTLSDAILSLAERVKTLENLLSSNSSASDSVSGRCYKLHSINVEVDNRAATKNGYLLFDESGDMATLSYVREQARPDFENDQPTKKENSSYRVSWTQEGSTVTTYRDNDEYDEVIDFTASLGRDIMFAIDVEPGSPHGEAELYLLNEMDCEEAETGENDISAD